MKRLTMPAFCLVLLCLSLIGMGTIALTVQSLKPDHPLLAALMRVAPFAAPAIAAAFIAAVAADHNGGQKPWLSWFALVLIPFVMVANILPLVLANYNASISAAVWSTNALRPSFLSEHWQNWSLLLISCGSIIWLFATTCLRRAALICITVLLAVTLIYGLSEIALHTGSVLIATITVLIPAIRSGKNAAAWYALTGAVSGVIGLIILMWMPLLRTEEPQDYLDGTYSLIAHDGWLTFTIMLFMFFAALVQWISPRLSPKILIAHACLLGGCIIANHLSQYMLLQNIGDVTLGPNASIGIWATIGGWSTMGFSMLVLFGFIGILIRRGMSSDLAHETKMAT